MPHLVAAQDRQHPDCIRQTVLDQDTQHRAGVAAGGAQRTLRFRIPLQGAHQRERDAGRQEQDQMQGPPLAVRRERSRGGGAGIGGRKIGGRVVRRMHGWSWDPVGRGE